MVRNHTVPSLCIFAGCTNWTTEPFVRSSTSWFFFALYLISFFFIPFLPIANSSSLCVIHLMQWTELTKTQRPRDEGKNSTRLKTKAIWCEWINGYSFFFLRFWVFQKSIPMVCKIYCIREELPEKRSTKKERELRKGRRVPIGYSVHKCWW